MNDKIKQLLENAEQSDAIAINKWRIENREQLRKERKEKLKELMEKDKQQTAVEWFAEMTSKLGYVSTDILEQAKEKEREQHKVSYWESLMSKFQTFEHYWEQTYGGNK